MNINPNAASASIAGSSRAAARGGESDNQASEASNQVNKAESPAGKSGQSNEVDAGDQADDRGGNGRQLLDVFESSDEPQNDSDAGETETQPRVSNPRDGSGANLDLEA